jgi:hypothetical protein
MKRLLLLLSLIPVFLWGQNDIYKTDDNLYLNEVHADSGKIKDLDADTIVSDTIYVKKLKNDTADITHLTAGNTTNLITEETWLGDKDFDTSSINNLEATIAKITDSLGLYEDDGYFTIGKSDYTKKYSWFLDGDTMKLYNHNDASENIKYYLDGIVQYSDTVKAVGFVASVIDADKIISDTTTIAADHDSVDVSGHSILCVNTTGGNVTIGGFKGGVLGQHLDIIVINGTNNTILEHQENIGGNSQNLNLPDDGDMTITNSGGARAIFDGQYWIFNSVAQ